MLYRVGVHTAELECPSVKVMPARASTSMAVASEWSPVMVEKEFPAVRLANLVAQRKAAWLLSRLDDLILDDLNDAS